MNIAVVGAGGYIGIPLCEELSRRGHGVIAVDRWFFGKVPAVRYRLTADVRQPPTLPPALEVVIDLAGLSNDASADIDPGLTRAINVVGGCRLAHEAREAGVRRYIYASSASVYGHGEQRDLTEESAVNPLTEYARSKLAVEGTLRQLQSSMETVILRNATVFGVAARMRFDLAVNIMTLRAWRDKEIYVMGGGEQWRPFVHIRDVVEAFVLAVEAPAEEVSGQIFNVGSDGNNLTIGGLAQLVHERFPEARVHHLPEDADKRSYHVSFDKIEKLGYKAERSVRSGIAEVRGALLSGKVRGDDPTAYTLQWYKSIMEWDKRLQALRSDGPLL